MYKYATIYARKTIYANIIFLVIKYFWQDTQRTAQWQPLGMVTSGLGQA